MDQIALFLNESEIPTIRALHWEKSTIENILKNETYQGKFEWELKLSNKKYRTDSHHDAIISPTLFHFYQSTSLLKQKLKVFNTPFLLQELLVCTSCEENMVGINQSTRKANGKQYDYYYYK